jgi:hypothetical protein
LEILEDFIPWIVFLLTIFIFSKLISWARKKKTVAITFGVLVQMFSPDPFAERTIEVVQQDKKSAEHRQQDDSDDIDQKSNQDSKS